LRVAALFFVMGCPTFSVALQTNTNCEWPSSRSESVHSLGALAADAEFAEDLAIRHADVCCGLGSPGFQSLEQYAQARDQCMAVLFQLLADKHGVSIAEVRTALGQRRVDVDLLIMLPYGLIYVLGAFLIVRWLWRRIGQEDPSRAAAMSGFGAAVVALIGVVGGEIWCDSFEMVRLGNGHLSYRETRVPWTHHRLELFLIAVLVFGLLTTVEWFRIRKTQRTT
jgi:hypothetical protein